MVTAIYDCRSKQEYIYRTNKMREISGASLLLSHIYEMFVEEAEKQGIKIKNSWKKDFRDDIKFDTAQFEKSQYDGEVIYEGGGNLNVIYKSHDVYVRANRIFSKMLLDKTYSVTMIAVCTETTDNFNEDRARLYRMKNLEKNQGTFSAVCNVLPITQIDRTTFMPVCEKKNYKYNGIDGIEYTLEYTLEARHKLDAYNKYYNGDQEVNTEDLDSILKKKGDSSMLAVIYIDGNDMGSKIQACTREKDDYPQCVNALREFSLNTDSYFVERPIEAVEKRLRNKSADEKLNKYRKIIGGGDEITLICSAEDAMDIVTEYFNALAQTAPLAKGKPNASCAGIAFFHSHMPFADVYEIAESCCESGKKKTRESGSTKSYIDFHYCHSGITNDMETVRNEQEAGYTLRPYSTEEFAELKMVGDILREIGRGNVKTLGEAVIKGDSYFQFEIERLKSRFKGRFTDLINQYEKICKEDDLKKMIYDISVVYDIWFDKGGNEGCTD